MPYTGKSFVGYVDFSGVSSVAMMFGEFVHDD